jgi:hypothetical protein
MNELEKLYNVLVREGKTQKTFEQFQQQYAQDDAYREKVYEVLYRDGFTNKSKEIFFSTYKPSTPVQASSTQQPAAQMPVAEEVKKKESTTALPSADGGLAQQGSKPRPRIFEIEKEARPMADATFVAKPKVEFIEKEVEKSIEKKTLDLEKKKSEDLFDKQTLKPRVDQSVYLKERLSNITRTLLIAPRNMLFLKCSINLGT